MSPRRRQLRTLEFEQRTMVRTTQDSQLFTYTKAGEGRVQEESRVLMQSRPLDGGEPRILGHFEASRLVGMILRVGGWPTITGRELYVVPVEELATAKPRLLGASCRTDPRAHLGFRWRTNRIASADSGEIRIWSLELLARRGPFASTRKRTTETAVGSLSHFRPPSGSLLAARSGTTNCATLGPDAGPPDSAPTWCS